MLNIARKVANRLTGKKVTERIKTIDDVLNELGMDDEDVIDYQKAFNFFGPQHHITAYQAVIIIAKSLNEGWVPDWNNQNEIKYYPWFEMGGSSGFRFNDDADWLSRSDVGSRLCYKTRELAEHAGRQFIELYKKFMTQNTGV